MLFTRFNRNGYFFPAGLARVSKNNKFGFVNSEGSSIIALKYDNAHHFSDGLASVELNQRWGLVSKAALEEVALKYSNVRPFSCSST